MIPKTGFIFFTKRPFPIWLGGWMALLWLGFATTGFAETVKEYYPKGNIHFERSVDAHGLWHGWTREYRESGALKIETTYVHGIRDGICRIYYDTGELLTEFIYKDDMRHGLSLGYYKSGKLKDKGIYKFDKLDGPVFMYSPQGRLRAALQFKKDKREGEAKTFHANGRVEHLYTYRKDHLIRRETFDEKGLRVRVQDYPMEQTQP